MRPVVIKIALLLLLSGWLPQTAMAVSFTTLAEAITSATRLLNNSSEGDGEGLYPPGARAALATAIAAASAFDAAGATAEKIDAEISRLYDACSTFESQVITAPVGLTDVKATKETRYLWLNLKGQMERSLLFGMQHATGYGVGWTNDDNRSDIKDVCGDFPAIYGEEMRELLLGTTVERFRYRITSAYQRGGVVTICWHQLDPDGRHYYAAEINNEKIVPQILPGGARNGDYLATLRTVAEFFKSLRGENGEAIPVIWRPYHEHLGGWFWWGVGHCTTDEFNQLWRFTWNYLTGIQNVHNLIWALSPNLEYVNDEGEYFDRFPGDDVVDIYGVDFYYSTPASPEVVRGYTRDLHAVARQALAHGKVPALTEIGQEGLDDINWHTRMMINPIKHDSVNNAIAYAVTWRNANSTHFHAPYPGHASVPDFINFYNDPYTLFEQDLPDMYSLPLPDLQAPRFTQLPPEPFVSPTLMTEIVVETDERALLRWSWRDEAWDAMSSSFTEGERQYRHRTLIPSEQGSAQRIYLQTMDLAGNKSVTAQPLTFSVDTLQAVLAWSDPGYRIASWNQGSGAFGQGSGVKSPLGSAETVYFARDFGLEKKPAGARILIQYTGGFALWLNGIEVTRERLPEEMALQYETRPLATAKAAKAVTLTAGQLALLQAGTNRIAVEVHGGADGVGYFDALLQTDTGMAFNYGSTWSWYEAGDQPRTWTLGELLGVDARQRNLPLEFTLLQNWPNPFNPITHIRYQLDQSGPVTLTIHDISGRQVRRQVDGWQSAGWHEAEFDGTGLASGLYACVLRSGARQAVRKMLFLK